MHNQYGFGFAERGTSLAKPVARPERPTRRESNVRLIGGRPVSLAVRQASHPRTQCNGTHPHPRKDRDAPTDFRPRTTRCSSSLDRVPGVFLPHRQAAIDDESTLRGKSDLKRIVSMLTRLIQRKSSVAADETEYEYRDTEYEYEYHQNGEA